MKRLLIALLVLALLPVCSFAEEWVCPVCGRTNTGNFCSQDAQPRPEDQICSACGTVNDADAKFCTNCANPFAYSVGNIITFGSYEGEPIEWKILEVKAEGTYLLMSEYGLDAKAYNTEYTSVNWETCSLRKWLNGDFLNSAFTEEERAKLVTVTNSNPDNQDLGTEGGNDTQDTVWLLSLDEVEKYCSSDSARICYPTQNAKNNGVSTNDAGVCWWWLRSPGFGLDNAAFVNVNGYAISFGYFVSGSDGCVRPVVVAQLP